MPSRLIAFCRMRPQLCAAALLLAWTCIVRLPFLHVVHDDEAFYSAVASRWLRGELPYVASFDVKAPGLFALFAAVQAVFGASLEVVKGVEIVFTAAGALGLYRLLTRHVSWRAAFWASLLYPVYSLILLGVSSPCQIVQAALTVWAFAFVLEALKSNGWGRAGAAGLMVGVAVTVKQTAALEAVAFLVILIGKRRARAPLLAFCAMAVLPAALFAAYFALAGHLADAWTAVVTLAALRSQANMSQAPDAWYLDVLARLGHYPALVKPLLVVTCGAVLALLRRGKSHTEVIDSTLVWYAGAAVGMLVVRSPEAWYAAPLIAPSLILFAVVLCHGIDFKPCARPLWTAGFVALAVVQPLAVAAPGLIGRDYRGPPDWRGNRLAASALVDAGLRPGDNLLVLSRGQYVYVLTGALPSARYFNAMHLMCRFPAPDADPLAAAFATRPKYVVMSDDNLALSCAEGRQLLRIRAILASDYVHLTTVTGTWDHFALYKIR
jgi:hypothetical protein